MRLLLLIPLLTSCASTGNEGHIEKSPNEKLSEKRKLYCELAASRVAERGYAVSECDGLLFTSLHSISCDGPGVDRFESEVEPGRFFRDPSHSCFDPSQVGEQGSDSTISKDMLIGLTAYAVAARKPEIIKRALDYGAANNWIVGDAKDPLTLASKCIITPSLRSLMQTAAGMELTDIQSDDGMVGIATGYEAHLQVLAILIKGKAKGSISHLDLAILKEQAKRQPRNAMFQAAQARYNDGDFSKVYELLNDEQLFPAKQLPNNHQNYCTDYLWQRDDNEDNWGKCPVEDFKEKDGTDLIFAAAIIGGAL